MNGPGDDGREIGDADGHRAVRELIGAYVLGQLDAPDRELVGGHLISCVSCRAEADALAPLARSLQTVDPDQLGPLPEPPADLGQRVLQRIGDEQRAVARRQWLRRGAAGLAVAASVVIAFVIGTAVGPNGPELPPGQPLAVTVSAGVEADAELVRHTWGTELRMRASGLRQGDAYAVQFLTETGARVSAGSIIGTGTNPLTCSLNAAVLLDDAASVQITDRSGTVVLRGLIG